MHSSCRLQAVVGTGAVNCSKSKDRRSDKVLQNIAEDIVQL